MSEGCKLNPRRKPTYVVRHRNFDFGKGKTMNLDYIEDDELCPCNSGKKYSLCCKRRNDDPTFNIEHYNGNMSWLNNDTQKLLNDNLIECCIHPNKDECSKAIIKAHSLQNNGVLSLLSKDGHVWYVKSEVNENGFDMNVYRVSKNKATTFTGFCNFHDTNVFKPIEIEEYNSDSDKQNFLYAYRVFAYEYYKKLVSLRSFQDTISKKPSLLRVQQFVAYYRNNQLLEKDITTLESIMNDALLNNDYSIIESHVIEFDYQIQFASSFGFAPEFDFEGNNMLINHLIDMDERRLPMVFMTIFPIVDKSYIITSWLKCDRDKLTRFIDSLINMSLLEVKLTFNNLIPEYSENIVISERLWSRFSEHQKHVFKGKLARNIDERGLDLYDIYDDRGSKRLLRDRADFNMFRKFE